MKKIKSFLVIDDDRASRFLSGMAIEEASVAENIIYCTNGLEALQYIKDFCLSSWFHVEQYCPELVLLYIHMPLMDGYAFLEELAKIEGLQAKQLSIILLTNESRRANLPHTYEAFTILGCIEKPLRSEALIAFLKTTYIPFQW